MIDNRQCHTSFFGVANWTRDVVLDRRRFYGFSADGSRCITAVQEKDEDFQETGPIRYEVWSLPFRAPWLLILSIPLAPILFVVGVRSLWRRWRSRTPALASVR